MSWFGQRQGQDGAELVNWAAHSLSGSDGRVGLDGCSYLGVTSGSPRRPSGGIPR